MLAVAALWHGLAVHGIGKWLAWKTVDSHCPKCEHPLRPDAPELPWVKLFKNTKNKVTGSAPMFTDGASSIGDEAEQSFMSRIEGPPVVPVRAKDNNRMPNVTENASEATALLG